MSKVTIETPDETPEELVEEIVEEIADEIADEVVEEAVTEVADASVTIAAIEADKEIKLAEIASETQIELQENELERETEKWTELQELRETVLALTVRLEAMEAANQSTPQLLTEAATTIAMESMEPEAENNLIPQSMSPLTSETETEVTLESADEKPEVATVRTRTKRRMI